jgi:transcriptional regulator GlxA family with amidase domain
VEAGPVTANVGITIGAGTALADVTGDIDTLIVAGGLSVRRHLPDQALTGQLGRLSTLARRTASVCNGALLLAEAGLARDVARGLLVYLHRPGGQSQFSAAMQAAAPDESMRELQAYIDSNPAADLRVPALARRAGLSERHFARIFSSRTGMPPGRYVERSRAEAACRLLETTDHPLDRIARETGIGAPETLFRVFRRLWRVAPGEYRRRFAAPQA